MKHRTHIHSLETETRAVIPTPEAAYHLNRAPQTLRMWSMTGEGPIKPIKVCGRLAWRVDDVKRVLGFKVKK